MDTKIVNYYKDKDGFEKCVYSIRKNNVVVFPTETVYGVGANALNKEAVLKIFHIKNRSYDNPLIVHVCDYDISDYVENVSNQTLKLINTFWPGPLTLILNKKDIIPNETTSGRNTVAIRMPRNEIALRLIRESGFPIAAPSANISGRPSGTNAKRCFEDLEGQVEFIIDGKESEIGIESTVVSMVNDNPVVLRPGHVTLDEIKKVLPNVQLYNGINCKTYVEAPLSPGLKYKHYSPRCEMVIVDSTKSKIADYIMSNFKIYKNIGILCLDDSQNFYRSLDKNFKVVSLGRRYDLEQIGKNLFESIRILDDLDCDFIVSECFSEDFSTAIMNRMLKAASFNVIKL